MIHHRIRDYIGITHITIWRDEDVKVQEYNFSMDFDFRKVDTFDDFDSCITYIEEELSSKIMRDFPDMSEDELADIVVDVMTRPRLILADHFNYEENNDD